MSNANNRWGTTVLKYLKCEAGNGVRFSVQDPDYDSGMFNSVALGVIKSKTNQLVLLGCVLNGSDFSRAFIPVIDPDDNTRLVRSE